MRRPGLEFTTEELLALCGILGHALPFPLRTTPIMKWPENVRSEVIGIGQRSLLARDLIREEDGVYVVPDLVVTVSQTLSAPQAQIVSSVTRDGRVAGTSFFLREGYVVGYRPQTSGNHRTTLVEQNNLVGILTAGIPAEVEASERTSLTIPERALRLLARRIAGGAIETPSRQELLVTGMTEDSAHALTEIITNGVAAGGLRALRVDHSGARGYEMGWIESDGLWIFDLPRDASRAATLVAASADDVRAQVQAAVETVVN